jgi:hypothetical protein
MWNTLPESNQQRVYNNTHATVELQIQQAENPTPSVVIGVEAACVDKCILLDYLASVVALGEPEIGCRDPSNPKDNTCTDDKHPFGMQGGNGDYKDGRDESDVRDGISTASQRG